MRERPREPRWGVGSKYLGGRGRERERRATRETRARVDVPRIRWLNCTVVGFSVMFLRVGEKARMSSGIHLENTIVMMARKTPTLTYQQT